LTQLATIPKLAAPCRLIGRCRGVAGELRPGYTVPPASETSLEINRIMDTRQFIEQTVTGHPVVLFMKGTSQFPQCGFSGRAIQILKSCGVKDLVTVNVLEDEAVRQGVKEYANWPTVPQLFVKGQFVGGSDIMNEMFENGELQQLLKQAQAI